MKKALHIFAVNGKTNSGDFFLGPATKWKFEKIAGEEINWYNFDVRKPVTTNDVNYFNTFDYVVVGGGGLLLPDTNPNMTSCWQWAISSQLINQITSKMSSPTPIGDPVKQIPYFFLPLLPTANSKDPVFLKLAKARLILQSDIPSFKAS